MTSAADFGAWKERACSPARGGAARTPGGVGVRAASFESHISSVGRLVVDKTVMAAHVYEHDLEVRESEAACGIFSETTEACGGAGHGFG